MDMLLTLPVNVTQSRKKEEEKKKVVQLLEKTVYSEPPGPWGWLGVYWANAEATGSLFWLVLTLTTASPWKWKLASSRPTLQPHGLYSSWDSPGQNTGVGSLSLLQQVFLTQESHQGLLHWRQILYQTENYHESPETLSSVKWGCDNSPSRDTMKLNESDLGRIPAQQ